LLPPFIPECAEVLFGFLQGHSGINFLQVSYQLLDVLVADILGRTADLVDDTPLFFISPTIILH